MFKYMLFKEHGINQWWSLYSALANAIREHDLISILIIYFHLILLKI